MNSSGKKMPDFSTEALGLISNYARSVEIEINNLSINLNPEYMKMLIFDIENDVRFFALKKATERRSQRVEEADVREVLKKLGKPEQFVKSHLGRAENCTNSQRITLTNLANMKRDLRKPKRLSFLTQAVDGEGSLRG